MIKIEAKLDYKGDMDRANRPDIYIAAYRENRTGEWKALGFTDRKRAEAMMNQRDSDEHIILIPGGPIPT